MGAELSFPPGFVFGVSTAAYQVEGGIENDWSLWERAGKLVHREQRCGRAVDHWNRFDEDLRLVGEVGATAFRVSLEWARIEPSRGAFDEAAVEEYRLRLQKMRAAGIRPVVTLHHFTHPVWFAQQTPWHQPECVEAFRRYVRVCAKILKGVDALVLTFNEPMVLLLGGYIQGVMPPGLTDGKRAMDALANLVRCHVVAREVLWAECGKTEMGISQNVVAFAPDRFWHPLDRALCQLAHEGYNHALLRALCTGELRVFMPGIATTSQRIEGARGSVDFIGLNYYTRAHLRFIPRAPFLEFKYRDVHRRGLTDIGWEYYPEGLSPLLMEATRYGLPLWITENGLDDRQGNRRSRYLYDHWLQVLKAIGQGANVRGYLHWALMDNFEWLEGWGPRFGLYRVDFDTLERTPTPAAAYFRETARSGRLREPPS